MPSSLKRPRPWAQHVALAVLFIIAVVYQVRVTEHQFPGWFDHSNTARAPFSVGAGSSNLTIDFLTPQAKDAGLHAGETLLAVNGQPVTGTAVYGEIIAHAHAGD